MIMKRIKIESVEPGDILFTARLGKLSGAIRVATSGTVSHAMICVQHGSFIDSTTDGVQARNLQRELFELDEKVFHFRLKKPLNRELLSKVLDFARAEVGARYSTFEAMRSVGSIRKPRSNRQFCSRLIARAFREAGIDLVVDADYCSPEDLKRSPLLIEVPIDTEVISEEEQQLRQANVDPVRETHQAQNMILNVARSIDPKIEHFNDLYTLLVEHPEADSNIAGALRDSGYLDLWKIETKAHPWRYNLAHIDAMTDSTEALRSYCVDTVREAYSGSVRFSINLVQLRLLYSQYPRASFRLKVELYEILVQNDQMRRETAYAWLMKNFPDDLKQNMEQIEPHSAFWYSIIDQVEPNLAMLSRHAIKAEGSKDICSSCGDEPVTDYRLVNGAETMPGVPSLRLCNECIEIRRGMHNVLTPFLPSV